MPAIGSFGKLQGNKGTLLPFATSADLITVSLATDDSVVSRLAALSVELVIEIIPMACRVPEPSSEQTL